MKRCESKETLHASSSKRARRPEEDNRRSYFLPDDITRQILLRLPAKSIARLRCVSKSFCTRTLDASFIRSHACRATTTLIIQTKEFYRGTEISDLYLINPDAKTDNRVERGATRIRVRYPVEGSLTLCGSCDGLLCFQDSDDTHWWRGRFYVCNPLVGDWIALPNTEREYWLCAFYFHPSRREYRLLIEVFRAKPYRYMVLTLGTNTYTGIESCGHTVSPLFLKHVLVNDTLHWIAFDLNNGYVIVAFDIEREQFRSMSLHSRCLLRAQKHLIKMGGSLALCQLTAVMEVDIWLLKDYEREVWIKQHTISFQCIFRSIYLYDMEYWSFLPVLAATEEELIFTLEHTKPIGKLLKSKVFIHYDFKTKEFKMIYGDGSIPSMYSEDCKIFQAPYAESLISCKSLVKECLSEGAAT